MKKIKLFNGSKIKCDKCNTNSSRYTKSNLLVKKDENNYLVTVRLYKCNNCKSFFIPKEELKKAKEKIDKEVLSEENTRND